jgi:hypothetical protein
VPVAISLGLPKWLPEAQEFDRCWLITPTAAQFHEPDPDVFASSYLQRLDRFGPQRIVTTLHKIAAEHGSDRVVLLCHERRAIPDCHRSLFSGWLLARTGEIATELIGGERPGT